MTSSAASTEVSVASLVMDMPGVRVMSTVSSASTGSVWVLSAVAVLSMSPSPPPLVSMSDWVTV